MSKNELKYKEVIEKFSIKQMKIYRNIFMILGILSFLLIITFGFGIICFYIAYVYNKCIKIKKNKLNKNLMKCNCCNKLINKNSIFCCHCGTKQKINNNTNDESKKDSSISSKNKLDNNVSDKNNERNEKNQNTDKKVQKEEYKRNSFNIIKDVEDDKIYSFLKKISKFYLKEDFYNGLTNGEIKELYSKVYKWESISYFEFELKVDSKDKYKVFLNYKNEEDNINNTLYVGYLLDNDDETINYILTNSETYIGYLSLNGGEYKELSYDEYGKEKIEKGFDEYEIGILLAYKPNKNFNIISNKETSKNKLQNTFKTFVEEFKLSKIYYDTSVVGTKYRNIDYSKIKLSDFVILKIDNNNKYDNKAIAIYCNNIHIGYLKSKTKIQDVIFAKLKFDSYFIFGKINYIVPNENIINIDIAIYEKEL